MTIDVNLMQIYMGVTPTSLLSTQSTKLIKLGMLFFQTVDAQDLTLQKVEGLKILILTHQQSKLSRISEM